MHIRELPFQHDRSLLHHIDVIGQASGKIDILLDEGVSQVLIPCQRERPNSYRLMNSPITRSCMRSVLEKQIVRRTNRLIRVRKLIWLLSIFCV